jgi:hypothetical protein
MSDFQLVSVGCTKLQLAMLSGIVLLQLDRRILAGCIK